MLAIHHITLFTSSAIKPDDSTLCLPSCATRLSWRVAHVKETKVLNLSFVCNLIRYCPYSLQGFGLHTVDLKDTKSLTVHEKYLKGWLQWSSLCSFGLDEYLSGILALPFSLKLLLLCSWITKILLNAFYPFLESKTLQHCFKVFLILKEQEYRSDETLNPCAFVYFFCTLFCLSSLTSQQRKMGKLFIYKFQLHLIQIF